MPQLRFRPWVVVAFVAALGCGAKSQALEGSGGSSGTGGSGTGGSAPAACSQTSDCVLMQAGCCAACDPITKDDLIAVRREQQGMRPPRCNVDGVTCGACEDVGELDRNSQYFVASCEQGSCQVLDLRTTANTECDSHDDCSLRNGSACCEGCDGTGLVALSSRELVRATCEADFACDLCGPSISELYAAGCDAEGRCFVGYAETQLDGRLLHGDAETCPPRADSPQSCLERPNTECTYAGGRFGTSWVAAPVTCFCDDVSSPDLQWLCVETDAEGKTACPWHYPHGDTCYADQRCRYGVGISVASCFCSADESNAGSFVCTL